MTAKTSLWAIIVVVASVNLNVAWASAPPCPYERAHYVLQSDPNVVARFFKHDKFKHILGDVFLVVTVKKRGWDYWYFPDTGNGYSTISLISMEDPAKPGWQEPDLDPRHRGPYSDEAYYGLNADLTFRDDLPMSGVNAPDLFLIPELAVTVWYDIRAFKPDWSRYSMPRAFFRLDHCE